MRARPKLIGRPITGYYDANDVEALEKWAEEADAKNKELRVRNSKLEKRYKTLKDKNADKGREIKELRDIISQVPFKIMDVNNEYVYAELNKGLQKRIEQALKK